MADNPGYADAISGIESGGKYDILGPPTKSGDQAYGKYQIMGANVGPWSKEILGQEMTPQEFLANPRAQDAVFQGKFGQYVQKYGPEGAAQAWIGGPGGVGQLDRKDSLGTSIGAYGQKFMAALGSGQGQNNAPAPSPGPQFNQPPQQTASLPAYGWSPGQQTPPQQQSAPQAQQSAPQAQQLPGAASQGGMSPQMGGMMQAPQAPQMQPMQMAQMGMHAPVDLTRLRLALSQLPAQVRPTSFS